MKNRIFYWVCDKSDSTGEGKLALYFINNLKIKNDINEIKKPKFKNKFLKKIVNHKYALPVLGIFYCWKYFFCNKKTYYINYLPFWNFLIFFLLPPNSNIGPITGGAKFDKKSNFIRKIIFPVCYKISEKIINYRKFTLIFSTELLKKFLSKKTIKKSSFNFIIKNFKYKKKSAKTIDFLIYFRNHENKIKKFPFKLIKNLINEGFKINVVGDKLKTEGIINHGFISNKKLLKLQKKAKFTIYSKENIYSIFILECISNNVIVLIEKSKKHKLTFFKNSFLPINFKNEKELNKIKYYL
ncbi:hypothetical protein N9T21_00645 [Candidatus Pelagibacter sp.]|nr:hypothetical protein [Candidatus Pelagibacter sp.]